MTELGFPANKTIRENAKNAKIFVRIMQPFSQNFSKINEAKNAQTKRNFARKKFDLTVS